MTRNPNKSTAEELEEAEICAELAREFGMPVIQLHWEQIAKFLRSDYAREGW